MQLRRSESDSAELCADMADVIQVQPPGLMHRWGLIADQRALLILFTLFGILFLTANLGSVPIQLWDESQGLRMKMAGGI